MKSSLSKEKELNADEKLLLQILLQHHNPRSQLFLAFDFLQLYPQLFDFLFCLKKEIIIKD